MNLFYIPDLQPDDITAFFPEEESIHSARVLRLKEGTRVMITNGNGWMFEATISVSHPKRTEAIVESRNYCPRNKTFQLHLAVAPTKNMNRYEWFLEKACEIGVDEITPLVTFHSERQKLNLQRMERVLIAAMKQSQTATLPRLNPVCEIAPFAKQYDASQKFVAWCGEKTQGELFDLSDKGCSIIVMIGPEGDFSEEEITMLESESYIPVSMGTSRLRTETAGVVACHTINLKNR